jgi:hypothetical protein
MPDIQKPKQATKEREQWLQNEMRVILLLKDMLAVEAMKYRSEGNYRENPKYRQVLDYLKLLLENFQDVKRELEALQKAKANVSKKENVIHEAKPSPTETSFHPLSHRQPLAFWSDKSQKAPLSPEQLIVEKIEKINDGIKSLLVAFDKYDGKRSKSNMDRLKGKFKKYKDELENLHYLLSAKPPLVSVTFANDMMSKLLSDAKLAMEVELKSRSRYLSVSDGNFSRILELGLNQIKKMDTMLSHSEKERETLSTRRLGK